MMTRLRSVLTSLVLGAASLLAAAPAFGEAAAPGARHEWSLDAGWRTAEDANPHRYDGFQRAGFDDHAWKAVDVPHNWDEYGGEHGLVHGNLHGTAWYRRGFELPAAEAGRHVLLYFEGVGSYATVWVNGHLAGTHAGGRTTFTLDVTPWVRFGGPNELAVRADHPADIQDLPWVCGGCSKIPGFSEGSQPMGIFRPVHLITASAVRVTPFGVHVWNDDDANAASATIHVTTSIINDESSPRSVTVDTRVIDRSGRAVAEFSSTATVPAGSVARVRQDPEPLRHVSLWSLESPYLYTLDTVISDASGVQDHVQTAFGIRTIHWPAPGGPPGQFLLNGKPVFINGTCEYEHLLGDSHAFGAAQIRARVAQIRAAGFNAVRDAHQPHNLRYGEAWERDGLLWWPQFVAQIWFDTPQFKTNFKTLLRDWVRERRNNPSVVLWGLANESRLPADFARECVAIIRQLDPTSPSQRLVTTCNGGKGADWNVPQDWSGTYGGNPEAYAQDLLRDHLVGEYGAWRSLGLHSEGGFVPKGILSENRAAGLLEMKIRLAESVRNRVAGHFQWLFATHDNPGRLEGNQGQQYADGWDPLDRIGPANNKGLLTLWGEPTDLFYLYRGAYAPAATDPMVYIVSHTWPDRWKGPGVKNDIEVYSNCDEVELYNDVGGDSLGVRRQKGPGTHFQWDNVDLRYNVLYAVGRVGGKDVAHDAIVLDNLPPAPRLAALLGHVTDLTAAAPGQHYLYRVNCGGADYTDVNGQRWSADRDYVPGLSWGSLSWAMDYTNVPPRFGSQRRTFDPIRGTLDGPLFQAYRYGRDKLRYRFRVPQADGPYRVELYFTEPWYGTGGGNCTGWRLFDVALNGKTVLHDLDLWREAGHAGAVKKVFETQARDGWIEVSFPRVESYQAVISAIAISTSDPKAEAPADDPAALATERRLAAADARPAAPFRPVSKERSHPLAKAIASGGSLTWKVQFGLGGAHVFRLRYENLSGARQVASIEVLAEDGTIVGRGRTMLAPSTKGRTPLSSIATLSMNAGAYRVRVTPPAGVNLRIIALVTR